MIELSAAANAAPSALDSMYSWGLSVIRAFQAAGNPAVTAIAKGFTLIGEPVTYVVIIALLFWCIDEKRGAKLGLVTFLSLGINSAVKEQFRVPRPFTVDPSVGMLSVGGFSTPSAHAQVAASFWPTLASGYAKKTAGLRRAFVLACAIVLPLCIGLSRIYLGVHYPTDVLFGWAIGAIVSVCAIVVLPRAAAPDSSFRKSFDAFKARSEANGHSIRSFKLAIAAFVTLILNAVSKNDSSTGGLFFGFAAGFILLADKGAFSAASGSIAQKTARLVVGLVCLGVIFFGLTFLVTGIGAEWHTLSVFAQYGIAGFWVSWGAPQLFLKTGLA